MLLDILTGKFIHFRNKIVKVGINKLLHDYFWYVTFVKQVVLIGLIDRNIPKLRVQNLRQETLKEYFGRVKGILSLVVTREHRLAVFGNQE
jgi:hypothetical protein